MATVVQLRSGNWRAQIRRGGKYGARTFRSKQEAEAWAFALERQIDVRAKATRDRNRWTFEELIDLYLQDMLVLGRAVDRSRQMFLETIRPTLGKLKLLEFTRPKLIEYGQARAADGAKPATVLCDFVHIRAVMTHAEAVHGVEIPHEELYLATVALRKLGLLQRSTPRRRRPTVAEIEQIIHYFVSNPRQHTPMHRVVEFAIATAMRQSEICKLEWRDVDMRKRLITVRNRKHPMGRPGNDDTIPLVNLTGYDAWQIILEQRILTRGIGRVFPYNRHSVCEAFHRACMALGIDDLRFHDLRREAATRLFEAGLTIEKVALITGHKSWDMLRRYTRLNPEDVVRMQKLPQLSAAEFVEHLLE